jgi:hypothetical protein
METLIAKKTLVNDAGQTDFVKGHDYIVITNHMTKITENIQVWDENNMPHLLGNWAKHFKVKNS